MRVYSCQGCPAEGTEKEQFKLVKIKRVGFVYCLDCVEVITSRWKAEDKLQQAHDALVDADSSSWQAAHDKYKQAFTEAAAARHAMNVREFGLEG